MVRPSTEKAGAGTGPWSRTAQFAQMLPEGFSPTAGGHIRRLMRIVSKEVFGAVLLAMSQGVRLLTATVITPRADCLPHQLAGASSRAASFLPRVCTSLSRRNGGPNG